jgi:hypothetical protein
MKEGHSWKGNWKVRLYERVRERGYDSLTAFAEARPTLPLVELAQELGGDDMCHGVSRPARVRPFPPRGRRARRDVSRGYTEKQARNWRTGSSG